MRRHDQANDITIDAIAAANDPYGRDTPANVNASTASGFSRKLNVKGAFHKIAKFVTRWRN